MRASVATTSRDCDIDLFDIVRVVVNRFDDLLLNILPDRISDLEGGRQHTQREPQQWAEHIARLLILIYRNYV